jgi:hypothetical protein
MRKREEEKKSAIERKNEVREMERERRRESD